MIASAARYTFLILAILSLFVVPVAAIAAVAPVLDQYGNPVGGENEGPAAPDVDGPTATKGAGTDGAPAEPLAATAATAGTAGLPFTGFELGALGVAGIALLGSGAVLRRVGRGARHSEIPGDLA